MKQIACTFFIVLLLVAAGCGGGGGGGTPPPPPTSAVIAFSLISTQRLPFRISGVELSAQLPAGVTVQTVSAGSKEIAPAMVSVGSAAAPAVAPGFPIFGHYSSPRVLFVVADGAGSGFGPGEMVLVTCSVAQGATVDANLLASQVTFLAAGIDPGAATNPSPLNIYLTPRVSVSYP